MNDYPLLNPSEGHEENLEKEYINQLLVRHKNALTYLFNKYANSLGRTNNNKGTFDKIGIRAHVMSVAELQKMLNHYNIGDLLGREEVGGLIRVINTKIFGKNELKSQDYDGFLKCVVNIASLVYSRYPFYTPHLSYALMLQGQLDMIDNCRRSKGESQPNFGDETETASMVAQKDLIDLMNEKLEENQNYQIPSVLFSFYKKLEFQKSS